MEQITQQTPETTRSLTFRDYVDLSILFGSLPALVIAIIFWAIATAFSHAGALPTILALLITLLLALMGIILIIRYVDICTSNIRKYNAAPSSNDSENQVGTIAGSGIVCGFLAISIVVCLSMAGTLEGWHYTLIAAEILLVGYQTWRVFLGRQA